MEVAEGDAQVSPALLQCDALQQCCRCSGNSSCSVVPSNCPEATAGQKGAVATQDKATKAWTADTATTRHLPAHRWQVTPARQP